MQATIVHHIEPHLVYKISIVERRSPQYCWPAETVRMHFGKQYGVEFYEGALIGVCFPFSRECFRRVYGLSSAISRHHLWLCSTGFCGPQERIPKNAFL